MEPWTRVAAKTAADACPPERLGDARALTRPGQTPRELIGALVAAEAFGAALQFLAHALPRREAVWWACRCIRRSLGEAPPAPALRAAERWAAEPSDEHRRAALAAAEAEGYETAAALAAAAAGWSGGNLAPPGLPAVAPAPHLTPRAAAGAVAMAAQAIDPDDLPAAFRAAIALGVRVAEGADLWPGPAEARTAPRP